MGTQSGHPFLKRLSASMMKTVVVFLCTAILAVNALSADIDAWQRFKAEHGLAFNDEVENAFRFKIFKENVRRITQHNDMYREGKTTYWMGLNKFSHLLHSEFAEMMLMKKSEADVDAIVEPIEAEVPEAKDWRTEGAVTPVKDQGSCGSCWAFSTTGAIESQVFVQTGKLVSLSEKNLMDCDWDYGNWGCSGGDKFAAMQYVIDNHGIDTEESYPYEAKESHDCKFNPANVGATISSYKKTVRGDEKDLKRAIGSISPMAVSVYVISSFQHYAGGVYTSDECPNTSSNHAILAVGYGHDDTAGLDYWIVKNSWGANWGENGYIRMARNVNNCCGIATKAGYPVCKYRIEDAYFL